MDRLNNFYDEYVENTDTQKEDTLYNKYLTFFIESQLYGIPISNVVQIAGMQEVTQVPEFPAYAKGVINLRGIIIPIIDIRLRLKKEEMERNERQCIIITNMDDQYMGFIVDSVSEVTDIHSDDISTPPKMGADYVNRYIIGIAKLNDNIVLLMDLNKILSEKEVKFIAGNFDGQDGEDNHNGGKDNNDLDDLDDHNDENDQDDVENNEND